MPARKPKKEPSVLKSLTTKARFKANTDVVTVWKPELLLHPNIPLPLHGRAPRRVLGENWWNRERLKAYKSTDFHCEACGVHKSKAKYKQWLEGHEVYDIDYEKGIMLFVRVTPLCHYCHNYIHDGRLLMLLEERKLNHQKYAAIIQHGDAVLEAAGLSRPTYEERAKATLLRKIAPWSKWRLVINGESYYSLYKNYGHYKVAHRSGDSE